MPWQADSWVRKLGKYELQVWGIPSPKGEFWVLAVRGFKSREIAIENHEVFPTAKAARVKAMKLYRVLKRRGK